MCQQHRNDVRTESNRLLCMICPSLMIGTVCYAAGIGHRSATYNITPRHFGKHVRSLPRTTWYSASSPPRTFARPPNRLSTRGLSATTVSRHITRAHLCRCQKVNIIIRQLHTMYRELSVPPSPHPCSILSADGTLPGEYTHRGDDTRRQRMTSALLNFHHAVLAPTCC